MACPVNKKGELREKLIAKGISPSRADLIVNELTESPVTKPNTPIAVTSTDVAMGADLGAPMRNAIANFTGQSPQSYFVGNIFGQMGHTLRMAREALLDPTRPSFARIIRSGDKQLHGRLSEAAAARPAAVVEKLMVDEALNKVFTENGKYPMSAGIVGQRRILFAQLLNSEQAKATKLRNAAWGKRAAALRTKQATGVKLSTDEASFMRSWEEIEAAGGSQAINVRELDPGQEALIQADPSFPQAMQVWKDTFQKHVEAMAPEAGVESFMQSPTGLYSKLHYYEDVTQIPANTPIDIAQGGGPGKGVWSHTRMRAKAGRLRKAKVPKGFAISEDLGTILFETLVDRYGAYTKRRLQNYVMDMDLAKQGVRRGQNITRGGVTERTTTVDILKPMKDGLFTMERPVVPKSVADAYNHVINPPRTGVISWLNTAYRYTIASALLVPAEAVMHGLGVLGAVASQEGLGRSGGRVTAALSDYGGIVGRTTGMLTDMWNMTSDTFRKDVMDMTKNGGLRVSHFDHTVKTEQVHIPIEKVPGIGALLHGPREYVFGLPDFSKKGLNGLETRARVAMYRGVRHIDPSLSASEAVHLVNNQLGTYVQALEPALVSAFKAVDPFARAGAALIKTGVKALGEAASAPLTIASGGRYGYGSVANAVSHVSTAVTLVATIKFLDSLRPDKEEGEGGRWPWPTKEHPKGIPGLKPGDIPIWQENGKRVDIPFRLISNTLYRGINVTGLRSSLEAYMNGETDKEQLTMEWLRGMANGLALNRLGPHIRGPFALASGGRTTYMLPGGEFMRTVPPSTKHPLKQAATGAMNATAPWMEKVIEPLTKPVLGQANIDPSTSHTRVEPDTPLGQVFYNVAKALGAEPNIHHAQYEDAKEGSIARVKRHRVREVAEAIVYELGNVSSDAEKAEFIHKALEQRLNEEERPFAIKFILSRIKSLPKRYGVSQAEAALMEEGMDIAPFMGQ
jgi:hypothetical protein